MLWCLDDIGKHWGIQHELNPGVVITDQHILQDGGAGEWLGQHSPAVLQQGISPDL